MIYVLYSPASRQQIRDMLEAGTNTVKVVVDVRPGILAGGGELHADCEAVLLEDGSRQEDIWGADWLPALREVRYYSFINNRPRQNNPSMELLDPALRARVEAVVRGLFECV
jgi:hypothetical protein